VSKWIERAKAFKSRMKAGDYLALGLAALLLMTLAFLFPRGPTQASAEPSSAASPEEQRLIAVLSQIQGAGRVDVMITYDAEPQAAQTLALSAPTPEAAEQVRGVMVVAEGAADLKVRLELARAVQTVLSVPASKVDVFQMQKEENAS
jgi:hypothetical protein